MGLFKKLWSKILVGIAAISPVLLTRSTTVNAEFSNDMPLLYGMNPVVYQQPTFWDVALRVLGYIAIPAVIIVLIIIGIGRSKKKRKK